VWFPITGVLCLERATGSLTLERSAVTDAIREARTRALIAGGEGPTVEFKSSLRWDYKTQKVNKELTKVVAKTVAAFLNSRGGTLLIGVDDHGSMLGLEPDLKTLGKKNVDGLELALRSAFREYLGPAVDPHIALDVVPIDDVLVAVASCEAHDEPVFVHEGDRRDLCVRAGNLTRTLDTASALSYAASHWKPDSTTVEEQLKLVVSAALNERFPQTEDRLEREPRMPYWLHLATRHVLDLFLKSLSRSHGWKRLDIISPWVSEVGGDYATLSYDQLLTRIRRDRTTVYLVTRPPVESWHERAIVKLAETGRANIAFVPDLHVKLYTAQTLQSSFAMFGSANFTTQSLTNREIGVLVSASGDGSALYQDLKYEAADIYRHPGRELVCKATI
jgi:hypothetical protein